MESMVKSFNRNLLGSISGKRVFLTGHTGFKGSWMCILLNYLGAEISGFSLDPPTEKNNFELSGVKKLLKHHSIGDIRDEKKLTNAIERANPEIIFHFAAQSLVRLSYEIPKETFDINIMGTISLLEVVRKRNKSCVIIVVTSDKCYRNVEQVWGYKETDPMGGNDPYSASKGACELIVDSYRNSFFHPDETKNHGIQIATARAGNVIGGGDWARDRIVPDILTALSNSKEVIVRSPKSIRPWQHVLEPLAGYLLLSVRMLKDETGGFSKGWNFGPLPFSTCDVEKLVSIFCDKWGDGSWIDSSQSREKMMHEANHLRLCIDQAVSDLNWLPVWGLEETIERIVVWQKAFLESENNCFEACLEDVKNYLNLF